MLYKGSQLGLPMSLPAQHRSKEMVRCAEPGPTLITLIILFSIYPKI